MFRFKDFNLLKRGIFRQPSYLKKSRKSKSLEGRKIDSFLKKRWFNYRKQRHINSNFVFLNVCIVLNRERNSLYSKKSPNFSFDNMKNRKIKIIFINYIMTFRLSEKKIPWLITKHIKYSTNSYEVFLYICIIIRQRFLINFKFKREQTKCSIINNSCRKLKKQYNPTFFYPLLRKLWK